MDQPSDLAARITAPNRKTTLSEDDELGLIYRPGAMRPFHEIYTPWNWRGWWDSDELSEIWLATYSTRFTNP